jgi:hypothetical protein
MRGDMIIHALHFYQGIMKPLKSLEKDAMIFFLIRKAGIANFLSSKKFGKRVFALSSDRVFV